MGVMFQSFGIVAKPPSVWEEEQEEDAKLEKSYQARGPRLGDATLLASGFKAKA